MKKIYKYYCLFFTGSLLPFLIVELYFQDYLTMGVIAFLASIVYTFCIAIEHLKVKNIIKSDYPLKKINYIDWLQKKEQNNISYNYFFRKNFL